MSRPAPPENLTRMDLDSLLAAYPQAAGVLARHGMLCHGCPIARFHTLQDAAALYRLDLAALVDEIQRDLAGLGPVSASTNPGDDG